LSAAIPITHRADKVMGIAALNPSCKLNTTSRFMHGGYSFVYQQRQEFHLPAFAGTTRGTFTVAITM
jgi:hypothetical protein